MFRSLQKPFQIIAAVCKGNGLGYAGGIPWSCPADMAFFKETTTRVTNKRAQNAVIMGRRTWESLPKRYAPLKSRFNVVITRDYRKFEQQYGGPDTGVAAFPSLLQAHMWLQERGDIETQFIIGGRGLYVEALQKNWSNKLYLTNIPEPYECDVFFPQIPSYYRQIGEPRALDDGGGVEGSSVTCTTYHNFYGRHYEEQYLYKMRELLHKPVISGRNGPVYTDFQWNYQMDLQDGLPLFSTRKAFWKGICKELLFFIHGDTNSKHLESEGVRIWQGNTDAAFLASRGLDYAPGDMGPMYGWVWRRYGARYEGMDADYRGKGHDQLRDVLDKLLHDPHNRRILMTAYDPSKVSESVLAPCHSIVNQFYVRKEGDVTYLDMFTYQRSADMFLGVYFNIPSDATLQTIIAKAVGMTPGKMYIQFGNCHVYDEHTGALQEQLLRTPEEVLPQLEIVRPVVAGQDVDAALEWVESLTYEDFKIIGYTSQKHIKAPMIA